MFSAAVFVYSHARKVLVPLLAFSIAVVDLCGSAGPVVAGFVRSARGARSFLSGHHFRRCSAIDPLPLGALGNRSLAVESQSCWRCISTGLRLNVHLPPGFSLAVDLLLGLSMLLMVFDDSSMHIRRLGVLNALTTTITRSQQHGPMTETALGELKTLMGAKAAWFRLLEGDKLVLTTQIGLSADYVRDRFSVPVDESLEGHDRRNRAHGD